MQGHTRQPGRHAPTGSLDTRGWCLYDKAADDHRAHAHDGEKRTLYLANPYGFSAQQRGGPLPELVGALESMGADVWEPFARNNQIHRASAGWAYRIGQADLRDVREADGLFAVGPTAVRRMRASWWSLA